MTTIAPEDILASEYRRARDFYSPVEPTYQAQLTLGQEEAKTLPINLSDIYGLMTQEIDQNPEAARSYANTFGATRVLLALDNQPTSFALAKYGEYLKGSAEVSTLPERTLGNIVCANEIDCPVTYLLADSGRPQTVEMSLVQAMHMVDTAIVTGLSNSATQLVRRADIETLLELKTKYPDLFLRTYGNVRGLSDTPALLGAVITTNLLEASGIETQALQSPPLTRVEQLSTAPDRERINASFIGITTAKKPHIGHGLLLAKAIADSPNGNVLVELNDRGPRVEQMITTLAASRGMEIDDVIVAINSGEISLEEIEASYKSRQDAPTLPAGTTYGLGQNNMYYRQLLSTLQPPGIQILTLANSEMEELESEIQERAGYKELFSGTGMDVFADESGSAMVVRKGGKTTLQGMMAQLALAYNLRLVDSPPALTRSEQAILRSNNMPLENGMGCGFLLDFASASGTNGQSLTLESLLQDDMPPGSLLAAMRKVMDTSTFFVSETGSLCPNFTSNNAFVRKLQKELDILPPSEITDILRRPIEFEDIRKPLLQELLRDVYQEFPVNGKIKAGEVCKLLKVFPVLAKRLPGQVIATAANLEDEISIPKNLYQGEAQKLLQAIRTCNAQTICDLLQASCESEGMYLSNYLATTRLGEIISDMGYSTGSTMDVMRTILSAKGVYKIL